MENTGSINLMLDQVKGTGLSQILDIDKTPSKSILLTEPPEDYPNSHFYKTL